MADDIDDAIAKTEAPKVQKGGKLRVGLINDRFAEIVFPVPLYAQDLVRIMKALGEVWGQMPAEELPAEPSKIVAVHGRIPPPS